MNMSFAHVWASTPARLMLAVAVTLAFALLARALRGVNNSGSLAGGPACFVLYASIGPSAFAALAALFLVTWASTRLGSGRKQELGVAERKDGRNGWQVLANLGVPALCALGFAMTGSRAWIIGCLAALAEAATDTVASEIGQTYSRTAILITNWKSVAAGTDGGVTMLGTLAGVGGALLISMVGVGTGLIGFGQLCIPLAAGVVGMLADSLLGATLQRRGWMNNEAVNFWGTLAAAGVGYAISVY
jgi:uncharacterized protein (TIGR00297 family)